MSTATALFELDSDADQWQPIFNFGQTCRDCGRTKFTWERGCAGAGQPDGMYSLCDDCAALDGRGKRGDGKPDVSRWGMRTDDVEASRLADIQRKRQGAWMRANRAMEQVRP